MSPGRQGEVSSNFLFVSLSEDLRGLLQWNEKKSISVFKHKIWSRRHVHLRDDVTPYTHSILPVYPPQPVFVHAHRDSCDLDAWAKYNVNMGKKREREKKRVECELEILLRYVPCFCPQLLRRWFIDRFQRELETGGGGVWGFGEGRLV